MYWIYLLLIVFCRYIGVQDPSKARGSSSGAFAGAAAMLQLRLLECHLALPDFASFAPQHEALTKLCSRSLRAASTATNTGC